MWNLLTLAALAAPPTPLDPSLLPEFPESMVDKAHEVCPYSNATRGNIEVQAHDEAHDEAEAAGPHE